MSCLGRVGFTDAVSEIRSSLILHHTSDKGDSGVAPIYMSLVSRQSKLLGSEMHIIQTPLSKLCRVLSTPSFHNSSQPIQQRNALAMLV